MQKRSLMPQRSRVAVLMLGIGGLTVIVGILGRHGCLTDRE
jgi:hypothetical protein